VDTLPDTQTCEFVAIRPLSDRFSVYGHQVEQVWRKDNVAVFARSIPGRAPHEYEVIIVRIASAGVSPSGSIIPIREEYPSSNKWGKFGWSIPGREQAIVWAEMVLANLGNPREERTAWPELFSQFKRKAGRG
jgi:hypothetical protein